MDGLMRNEKNDISLDADILQSKADIQAALRAAGKSVLNETPAVQGEASISSQDTLLGIDLSSLEDQQEDSSASKDPQIPDMSAPASTEMASPSDELIQTLEDLDRENKQLKEQMQQLHEQ
ncbi:MAG TPA: hypothetical protein PK052_12210, partial [Anaerohalosphaeraceae bacterium]|nr:hypothetical protein [Anaerohalosphaeraceae bacterium]